jgi:nitrate reductase gamma subunit
VAAWSDTRNGDEQTSSQDIYAAPMAFDSSSIPAGKLGAQTGYGAGDLVLVGVIVGLAGLLAGAGATLLLTRRAREARTRTPVP